MLVLLLAQLAAALEPAPPLDVTGPKEWLGGDWLIVPGDRSAHQQERELGIVWELMPRFGAARWTGADGRAEIQRTDAACGLALTDAAASAEGMARLSMRAPTEVVARRFRWMDGKACSFEVDVILAAHGAYGGLDR